MGKNFRILGFSYVLRPVTVNDAQTIIDIRLQDTERNKYIHKINDDLSEQIAWIEAYLERADEYYFIVENNFTREAEGLISIYNIIDGKAEWGRWALKKGSMASVESVYLIFKLAFDKLGLDEVKSIILEDNALVIAFHESMNQKYRGILGIQFEGKACNAKEYFVDKKYFNDILEPQLQEKCLQLFKRNVEMHMGSKFIFHHIGIASSDLKRDLPVFYMLGYRLSSEKFIDKIQGVQGYFLAAKDQPCIEILENLPGHLTLNRFLESNHKMYHIAYYVENIEQAINTLQKCRAKVLSDCKISFYFQKRICFLIMSNRLLIELIEK